MQVIFFFNSRKQVFIIIMYIIIHYVVVLSINSAAVTEFLRVVEETTYIYTKSQLSAVPLVSFTLCLLL